MDNDIIYYAPQDLRWTKPHKDFRPENPLEFGRKQCEILHEARNRLMANLMQEDPRLFVGPSEVSIIMDPSWSKADKKLYAPVFAVSKEARTRFFQVLLARKSEEEVDTENPLTIREVTEKIKDQQH